LLVFEGTYVRTHLHRRRDTTAASTSRGCATRRCRSCSTSTTQCTSWWPGWHGHDPAVSLSNYLHAKADELRAAGNALFGWAGQPYRLACTGTFRRHRPPNAVRGC